jgi:hypothetical protein
VSPTSARVTAKICHVRHPYHVSFLHLRRSPRPDISRVKWTRRSRRLGERSPRVARVNLTRWNSHSPPPPHVRQTSSFTPRLCHLPCLEVSDVCRTPFGARQPDVRPTLLAHVDTSDRQFLTWAWRMSPRQKKTPSDFDCSSKGTISWTLGLSSARSRSTTLPAAFRGL